MLEVEFLDSDISNPGAGAVSVHVTFQEILNLPCRRGFRARAEIVLNGACSVRWGAVGYGGSHDGAVDGVAFYGVSRVLDFLRFRSCL